MNRFTKSLFLWAVLVGPLAAEEPSQLGQKSAFNIFAPVPEETARAARARAEELLGPYLKKLGGNHLCQRKTSPAGEWMELQGLKIQRVTAQAVSHADQTNGIQEKLLVIVDCVMYRTRKLGASSWSAWVNGRPLLFPSGINVEHRTNGSWSASSSTLQYLNIIGTPQPAANPANASRTQTPATAGLPPGMNRAGSGTVPSSTSNTPQIPPRSASAASAIPPRISTVLPAPSPPNAESRPANQPSLPAQKPTTQNNASDQAEAFAKPIKDVIPLLVVAIVTSSAFSLFFKKRKRSARSRNQSHS